jgi:predicted Rossmann fold flavoprotein
MKKNIAIIGAGASGLVAAISAAQAGAKVTIYEKNSKLGKKIHASGNGRCNITNENISLKNYHGKAPHFAKEIIKFDVKKFFNSLGLELRLGNGTRLYPLSHQASVVVDYLGFTCRRLGVEFVKECTIERIEKREKHFILHYHDREVLADAILIATGSSAMPNLGGCESGYHFANAFGHHIEKPFAALVQLTSAEKLFTKASGVKIEANLEIYVENQPKMALKGDLLFTSYGLSGSAILDLSRIASFATMRQKDVFIMIDLLPDFSQQTLKALLQKQLTLKLPLFLWLNGILPKKLIEPLLQTANIDAKKPLNHKTINTLAYTLKNLKITISGTRGTKGAEIMAGGVSTEEIDAKTMESKKIKGLFFAGEVIDIDGDCGGYNLHWAFSSGFLAGHSMAHSKSI